MKKRVITGFFIFLVTALAVISKIWLNEIFDIFIAIIAVVSASEVVNMMKKKGMDINGFMACMYLPIMYIPIIFFEDTSISIGQLFLLLFIFYGAWTLVVWIYDFSVRFKQNEREMFHNSIITTRNTALVGIYPAMFLSMFLVLNHLAGYTLIINKYLTLWMIVLVFTITMLTDTFAYFVGSKLRGPKVCPKISPNKSWSGCVGGLIGGIVGALLVYLVLQIDKFNSILTIMDINALHFVLLGVFGSVISQVGDFFESYLKRKAEVKDSGNIFPGHGGMLDRIDALMFNTVFVTIFVIAVIL